MSILTGFVANVIFYEMNTYAMVSDRKEGRQNTQLAMRWMTRDLRQIVSADSIFKATADSIRFRHVDGQQVKYQHRSSKLYRNDDLLAENLTDFAFSYFDDSRTLMNFPISDTEKIRSVGVRLSAKVNGETVHAQTTVAPRNF